MRGRQEYRARLLRRMIEIEEAQRREQDREIEQWMLERETARLQREIEDKNRLFMFQVKKRENAAITIQRAFRAYRVRSAQAS